MKKHEDDEHRDDEHKDGERKHSDRKHGDPKSDEHKHGEHKQDYVLVDDLSEVDKMLPEDDERSVVVLNKALESLDSGIPLLTPSGSWFQQQIMIRQAENRKQLMCDMIVFGLVAVAILSALISVAQQEPSAFLMVQMVSLVIAPIILVLLPRKRVKA
jgi:hypothetical protein